MVLIAVSLQGLAGAFFILVGYDECDEYGSNLRRFCSRFTLSMILLLGSDVWLLWVPAEAQTIIILFSMIWAVLYFKIVVVVPIFMVSSSQLHLSSSRFLCDILTSAGFSMLAASQYFGLHQIVPGAEGMVLNAQIDPLYFSAVTFSTLGFGDFRPSADARFMAALLGLWGNIHLGLLAGAMFYALNKRQSGQNGGHDCEDQHSGTGNGHAG